MMKYVKIFEEFILGEHEWEKFKEWLKLKNIDDVEDLHSKFTNMFTSGISGEEKALELADYIDSESVLDGEDYNDILEYLEGVFR